MPETRKTAYKRIPAPANPAVTQSSINERLADMVWRFYVGDDGEQGIPLTWLRCLGCGVQANGDGSYIIEGTSGMTCGLIRSDPITVFVQFAFALAGVYWPQVFDGAQKIINNRWGAETKQKKAGVALPPEPLLPMPPDAPLQPRKLR